MDEAYARFSRLVIDRPHPRVLRVVMNRPDKLNATDGEMHSELTEIWRVIDADASVSAVLLTGAGKAFSAGGGLDLLDKMIADVGTRMRVWKEARDMVYNLINCSKPVVAAINGAAVGAGLALAILADISIGSRYPPTSCRPAPWTWPCAWPRARRTRYAQPSTPSTTGCERPGRSSTPRSAWNSSASAEPKRRKAERPCGKSARRDFRPTRSEPRRGQR